MRTTPDHKITQFTANQWWGEETLHSFLDAAVSMSPDQEALIDPLDRESLVGGRQARLTFRELREAADRMGESFYASGLRQGDIMVLQLPNTVEIIIAYMAASRLGIIVSPMAMQYGSFECRHIAGVLNPQAYLTFASFKGEPMGESHRECFGDRCAFLQFDGVGVLTNGGEEIVADTAAYLAYVENITVDANDIFSICWTSGTTGRPKGVPRSHNHWKSSALTLEDAVGQEPTDVMLAPFPFINMAAIGGCLYFWMHLKFKLVLHHPFDPTVFLTQLQEEKVTYTLVPPAILNKLLLDTKLITETFDLSALRVIGSGSAPLSPDMIRGFKDVLGVEVVNIFGSNEGVSLVSGYRDVPNVDERAVYFPRFGRPEYSWSNRTAQRMQTKLIDLSTGEEILEQGKSGELWIAGATVFDGYYRSDDDNAEAFSKDGFFRTGDMFEIAGENSEFYLFTGRCKDIIVRGGIKISPEELDNVIGAFPSILECAVCGYPDDVMGEKVALIAVPKPGQDVQLRDVQTYLDAKGVAKFKWPEKVVILETLPRNPMNKIVRSALVQYTN